MDSLIGLLDGIASAVQPELLVATLVGAFIGTLIGVLPGIGPVAGSALVLPFTFQYGPTVAIAMVVAIYLGSQFGSSTSAVLIKIPGEVSSIPATIDGYAMAQKGRAGAALTIMAVGSFIAGTISLIAFTFAAPVLTDLSLNFGPAEFFALTAGGLVLLARISGGSLASGLFPMALGIMLGTVGQEASSGIARFTFDSVPLLLGFSLVSLAVGMYGMSELARVLEDPANNRLPKPVPFRELAPDRTEWKRSLAPWGRGTVIGFLFGLLPVPSATLGAFASYRVEQSVSKHRDEFGSGAVEGIAGPEAANNSAVIGGLVPLLVLGLPFSATLALVISAMQVQGIQPGPLLITQHPEVFWAVIGATAVANVILLILNVPLVGFWASILRVPQKYLVPMIMVIAVVGTYSYRNSMFDVYTLLVFGVVGYLMHKLDLSLASLLLGLVLGPLIEKYFIQVLYLGRGDPMAFFSGIAGWLWAAVAIILVVAGVFAMRRRRGARQPLVSMSMEQE
ncbi:tripartite tricarboxylate transporter permease [Microbacterium ulmi]|uniref:Tripartite tricarboxylate transporter TctA n=1 Tax=Microbacterium ulmi TaxID=179095 RepID=A0A7Y2Q109_9MICO|nr:putative tricarboxylic transport membrane protein [Microbacterium ulmi]NNH03178.1 tripartite tricarboxylate transporter TctA [Microbacterium ulmi]